MARLRSTLQLIAVFIFSQLHAASSLRSEPRDESPVVLNEDLCGRPEAPRMESQSPATDGMFQDARLIGSFALGIAFMHAMEVLKPGRGTSRKFELYPYVL
ncbi:unnamed protein product [Effrenium voratum]|uniref:Uncharacterized protein n=1 Tax=Effrenium voratum TaxID=2562239 RepID=A0AA36J799_9DINO|nr:unnamed protein product [Effrenium voratum]CAJ1399930.1 unnamed protein product [Effrenium voratum]